MTNDRPRPVSQGPQAPTEDELLTWMDALSNWGRWGPADQRGTLNLITPEVTRRALDLVSEGVSVSCALPLSYDAAPDVSRPPMHFMLESGDAYPPGGGPDRQVAIDFLGMVFHGHTVTHLDSLSHFFWKGRLYNVAPSTGSASAPLW